MTDELRKLAEAAYSDQWDTMRDLLANDGYAPVWVDYFHAASPAAVLALLDRIEELEASNRACVDKVAEWGAKAGALQAEVDKHIADNLLLSEKLGQALGGNGPDSVRTRMYHGQRDEAREAVKRLAGALEEIAFQTTQHGGAATSLRLIRSSLADPVVKRIVEGE